MFGSKRVVVRVYKNEKHFQSDANRWAGRGYDIATVNGVTPNVAIGETVIKSVLTLGWGLVFGGRAHKTGKTTVVYRKMAPAPMQMQPVYLAATPVQHPQGWEPPHVAKAAPRTAWTAFALGLIVLMVVVAITMAMHS